MNKNPQKATVKRQAIRKARAEVYFLAYYELGPERSLEKLREKFASYGLKKALNTYKNYSADFGWQQKVIELDAKLQAEREQKAQQGIIEMNERQAKYGRGIQAIGTAIMAHFNTVIREKGELPGTANDLVTLMEKGSRIERLAMGEATDRVEAISLVWNVMVVRIQEIFREVVSDYPFAEDIAEQFDARVNEYRSQKLREINRG